MAAVHGDRKQKPGNMAVYLAEEVFELLDAIESDNIDAICEEIGDVLFQVIFIVVMYNEKNRLTLNQVIRNVHEKMVRRHPHVFGNEHVENAEDVRRKWHEIKKDEKKTLQSDSVLDAIPAGLPSLMRSYRILERASRSGLRKEEAKDIIRVATEKLSEIETGFDVDGDMDKACETAHPPFLVIYYFIL